MRKEQSGWTNSRIVSSRLSVRRSSGTASQQRPAANQDMGDGLIAAIFRQVLKLDSLVRASALTCSAGALLETPDQQSRNTGCNHTPHSQLTFSAALRILNSIDPNRADGRANKFRQELHSRSRVHTATIPSRGYPGARILGGGNFTCIFSVAKCQPHAIGMNVRWKRICLGTATTYGSYIHGCRADGTDVYANLKISKGRGTR